MASEIDSLQARLDAIRATGDVELMHTTFLRLGRDLRAYFNQKCNRKNFKRYHYPFTQAEVDAKLSDLARLHAEKRE